MKAIIDIDQLTMKQKSELTTALLRDESKQAFAIAEKLKAEGEGKVKEENEIRKIKSFHSIYKCNLRVSKKILSFL